MDEGVNYVPTGSFITPIAKVPPRPLVAMDEGVNYVPTGSFITPCQTEGRRNNPVRLAAHQTTTHDFDHSALLYRLIGPAKIS